MIQKIFPILLMTLVASALLATGDVPEALAGQSGSSSPMARPWVGVVLGDTDSRAGVAVARVLRRSPAHAAGIEDGDRILSVNGEQVRTVGKLQMLLRGQPVGRSISLSVERHGQTFDVDVELVPSPSSSEVVRLHLRGFEAPEFALHDLQGDPIDVEALSDRPLILEFWATWCTACRRVTRLLEEAAERSPDAFYALAITAEDAATVERHLETRPMSLTIGLDGENTAHDGFLINSYPVVIVIGSDGRVTHIANSVSEVEAILEDFGSIADPTDDDEDH